MNNLQLANELDKFFNTEKSSDINNFCNNKTVKYLLDENAINNNQDLENIIKEIVVTAFKGKNQGDIIQGLQDFAKSVEGVNGRIERIDALVKIADLFKIDLVKFKQDFNDIKADPTNLDPMQRGKEKIDPAISIIDKISTDIAPVIEKKLQQPGKPSFIPKSAGGEGKENTPPRNS